ncbi:hypothetical protein CC1G_13686 [Coprinopsis cinerea okayama7|uniref:Metallo-beta-lactamase domain-containing protein n=1 Tax=Coprinopsis cinerea (strain Okayama-7 / 130 / ATCC MYA-4618 / FGSC 9003) TaxID=240176 RepID=D6RJY1_COPC7|nr:hypothetical protein CC1G_13686 [Coprinopsis cinerea okayama7\|eukprot:XP_002912154.1 hypothetical protein CC1G_13686 [Coprinopsis cinerea okayama7\
MTVTYSNSADSANIELIFLGTGTSSSLPQIACITRPPDDPKPPCRTCLSTLTPAGRRNIRRNTSAALRVKGRDGQPVTIVIDVGKNFQAAALEWFPKYGLRKIDALLITHAHADAMNGLDDLRAWTLRGAIQSHIDVYVSADTFSEVKRSFPYLVSKEFASGGGDVPEFQWHIIQDQVPFEIGDTGIRVVPFAVHHGRLFTTSTSNVCEHPTPPAAKPVPLADSPPLRVASLSRPDKEVIENNRAGSEVTRETVYPYLSFGYKIQERLVYISDVSHIPEHVWPLLEPKADGQRLAVTVLDCLRLGPHTSHFGLEDSLKMARRINATRTYLTGFGHEVSHDEYVRLGEIIGGTSFNLEELSDCERRGVGLIGSERGLWVRPSHDGLRVFVGEEGDVRDESY